VKVYLAQINPIVGDLEGNAARIRAAVGRAVAAGADLAVFPELVLQGYPPRDLLEKPSFVEAGVKVLEALASDVRGIDVIVGFAEPNRSPVGNALFNSAAILRDGAVAAIARKTLLPTYDVFDEDRHFEPATTRSAQTLAGVPSAVTICEDAWADRGLFHRLLYPSDPVAELAGQGAKLIINISASPYSIGRPALRERLMQQQARRHGLPLVCVNQVGGNDELLFDGTSVVVDAQGRTRVRLASFEEEERLVDLDMLPPLEELAGATAPPEEEEVYRALVMGTRDYVRKCGFGHAVLGLSGGIDSALVAAVAADALGPGHVHGIAMPARYSSPESLEDATALAGSLGVDLRVIGVDDIFQRYLDVMGPEFAGRPPDVTEENLQARIRGNVLMALSNKFGWLVLTTGNKSELAVGYCTLYGDMSGGLAVISDVPKTLVYRLSRWINRDREIIPGRILRKPPSAELRPGQKDEDSLPPYEVLDGILRLYVEEGRSAAEIAAAGTEAALVREVIGLVDRNEYKRKQAPPGLRVTTKAFGLGRRMPIAQRYRET
jgi:NAD+ synthetase